MKIIKFPNTRWAASFEFHFSDSKIALMPNYLIPQQIKSFSFLSECCMFFMPVFIAAIECLCLVIWRLVFDCPARAVRFCVKDKWWFHCMETLANEKLSKSRSFRIYGINFMFDFSSRNAISQFYIYRRCLFFI